MNATLPHFSAVDIEGQMITRDQVEAMAPVLVVLLRGLY